MSEQTRVLIHLNQQSLVLLSDNKVVVNYSISSALNGAGETLGSEKTPRGRHLIRAKIGAGLPDNAVLVGRRFSGEIYTEKLARQYPHRDWILTRILWLCGCEAGKNRFGQVDSMQRYIYIHGTPDSEPMGIAKSHGCIRMRNHDIIDFFERVPAGCPVEICE